MSKSQNRRNSARVNNARSAGDYAVGYGRPPKDHQFKPGQSGNPKGRPKSAQSEVTILRDILHERIEVQQTGRSISTPFTSAARSKACLRGFLSGSTILTELES